MLFRVCQNQTLDEKLNQIKIDALSYNRFGYLSTYYYI